MRGQRTSPAGGRDGWVTAVGVVGELLSSLVVMARR